MLIKLLVSVFERAKAKFTSNHRRTSDSPPDLDDCEFYSASPPDAFIVEQPTRSTFTKWLCTTPAQTDRSSGNFKSSKVRRSSSWRSLKERSNHPSEQINARTLSVDELHRNGKKQQQKNNSLKKKSPSSHRSDFLQSTIVRFPSPNEKHRPIRLSNCDESVDLISSTFHPYADPSKSSQSARKSQFFNQSSGHTTSSGGADSGYSEDSFALTRNSSQRRPLHTSCPHCHCEQRSSTLFTYRTSMKKLSSESSMSDLPIDQDLLDAREYSREKTSSLATSRSYPHIKPLPRTKLSSQIHQSSLESQQQQRRTRTLAAKRRRRQAQRRHLSCDSSLIPKQAQQPSIQLRSSPVLRSPVLDQPLQRHFTTIGVLDRPQKSWNTISSLPKTSHIFGELNLEAIELDSLRPSDHHRPSFSSSYSSSLTSSSSSLNTDKQSRQSRQFRKKTSKERGIFLVWHEYQNPSLLSTTHGTKLFSVVRGDQVRLLRRIGKSTLLVEKQGDGSIGFLPQSCLADDQINSFLSVKGLKETIL